MKIDELEKLLKNEPSYRVSQIKKAIFVDLIENFNEMSSLPKNLREILSKKLDLKIISELEKSQNNDVQKVAITLSDGLKIESVLLKHADNRNTVCVSSQVGCPMKCSFCLTGKMGFKRNLNEFEIIEQVLFFERLLKKQNLKTTNIVFMGMGEPMLNYENVIRAIKILNDKQAFNIGARKISISTCGIINGIESLEKEKLQINLAISLHAPNNKIRNQLMPVNKSYSIEKILDSVDNYINKTNRKVMFEYALIDGVNDSKNNAEELSSLMSRNRLYMLNLIKYNDTGYYRASTNQNIKLFKEILTKNHINFTQRYTFGTEISAACGQLIQES
jgi:23S rRNA (adenine2503-C2)-methyltransferase